MSTFKFSTPLKVRFDETDLQGHVNFGHYLFYFDVGLTEYMEAIGYDYRQMLADGTDLLYAESHCNYKSSAKWPEVLHVHARVGHMGKRSLRFEFEVRAAADDRVVATGHIVAVTANKQTYQPWPVPDRLRNAINAYESETRVERGA